MLVEEIRIRGLVQGVGFRPFIWRLAVRFGVSGEVCNDGEGVLIRAAAEQNQLDAFAAAVTAETPPLAQIVSIERMAVSKPYAVSGFNIAETKGGPRNTGVVPDSALCAECLAEISEPADRRHAYAFANCTHCGPRFSIIEAIPYDRATTTMRSFEMCRRCRAEYDDPADRRFHAQPIACADCGPRLQFIGSDQADDPVKAAANVILSGGILALKGLGGFHLACDATNEIAVALLRRRKIRPDKPFALMADLNLLRAYTKPAIAHEKLLSDAAAPIVLIEGKHACLAPSLAPGLDILGWMLPYTPLHVLLCNAIACPLVMTSGNLSGEPQVIGNEEALEKLAGFADAFLLHDRRIARRLDDSVVSIIGGEHQIMRRARGFAPSLLEFPASLHAAPPLLALGGELKSAICLASGSSALLSHHMGDLEDALSYEEFEKAITDYKTLFGYQPEVIICDAHPAYRSSLKAQELADACNLPLIEVQHHHAHIASAMAENGWPLEAAPVLGVALDGTGYGADGTVWGGEWLLCHYDRFERLASLRPVPLPGSGAAIREPWRNLVAQAVAAFGETEVAERFCCAGLGQKFAGKPLDTLLAMIHKGVNTPLTSSAGRLFDAVGAAVGAAFDKVSYEGQSAMEAESLARQCVADRGYVFDVVHAGEILHLDAATIWPELFADLEHGDDPAMISARFHLGFAQAAAALALKLARRHQAGAIALSGGVMQNRVLMHMMLSELSGCGLPILRQQQVPVNDGGLAFGQAAGAAARLLRR